MSVASFFTGTPMCPGCEQNTSFAINNPSPKPANDIGDIDFSYYECENRECKLLFFNDYRGILDDNPACQRGSSNNSNSKIWRGEAGRSSYIPQLEPLAGTLPHHRLAFTDARVKRGPVIIAAITPFSHQRRLTKRS